MKPSLFDLSKKNAVVTGGSGFLGRYFCRALADYGANVAIVDVDEAVCKKFALEIAGKYEVKAVGIGCDVSDPQSVRRMVSLAEKTLGPISILHNNAATKLKHSSDFYKNAAGMDLSSWREVMAVNLDGMFLVAQTVGGRMARHQGGSIIQTASIYGLMAPDQRIYPKPRELSAPAVYTASKAGVIGLTKHLAADWASKNIRVNAIVPGGVENGQDKTFIQNYSRRVPMGRMAKPNEMTGALIFLASDASSYVTGQCLVVDGGLSVW
ncbi:MAG: SDR family oxidoreductase [Candidatus Omnitrophica bacterium]|nr:SDR family oxidoreductase [Candidatus Omnitrophota bacterium]